MSTIGFQGRVAAVTGAGNGLGRDYALQLAARGAAVVVNDIGVGDDGVKTAETVAAQIRAAGGRAIACTDSVSTRAGADAIVAAAMDGFGRIDIVINNAGNQRNGRLEQMSDEDFTSVLDVHLTGAFMLSRAAYARMIEQRYGRILFTSSASGMFGHFIRANYNSAKTGVIGLMHTVALEGQTHGILANALMPMASSPGTRLGKVPEGTLLPQWAPKMPENAPDGALIGPGMSVGHVTPLVLYLVSERCTSTHAIWSALGGRYARVFIGVTQGWLGPQDRPATPEEIESNLARIEDRGGYDEPAYITEEVLSVIRHIKRERRQ
ncbi:MAG: SDR family NAD(P)-dependent oxidoreductase [Gammaproteobacteria bacterium]